MSDNAVFCCACTVVCDLGEVPPESIISNACAYTKVALLEVTWDLETFPFTQSAGSIYETVWSVASGSTGSFKDLCNDRCEFRAVGMRYQLQAFTTTTHYPGLGRGADAYTFTPGEIVEFDTIGDALPKLVPAFNATMAGRTDDFNITTDNGSATIIEYGGYRTPFIGFRTVGIFGSGASYDIDVSDFDSSSVDLPGIRTPYSLSEGPIHKTYYEPLTSPTLPAALADVIVPTFDVASGNWYQNFSAYSGGTNVATHRLTSGTLAGADASETNPGCINCPRAFRVVIKYGATASQPDLRTWHGSPFEGSAAVDGDVLDIVFVQICDRITGGVGIGCLWLGKIPDDDPFNAGVALRLARLGPLHWEIQDQAGSGWEGRFVLKGNGGCCPSSIVSGMPGLRRTASISGSMSAGPYISGFGPAGEATTTEAWTIVWPTVTVTEVAVPVGTKPCNCPVCFTCEAGPSDADLTIEVDGVPAVLNLKKVSTTGQPCKYEFTGVIAVDVPISGSVFTEQAYSTAGFAQYNRFRLIGKHAGTGVTLLDRYLVCSGVGTSQMLGTYITAGTTAFQTAHTVTAEAA